MGHLANRDTQAIFAYVRTRFGGLPGFRLQEQRLVPPEDYAAAGQEFVVSHGYVSEGESA
jgi:hypothetical protein